MAFPSFLGRRRPQKKRDLHEPLLIAMAQVLHFLGNIPALIKIKLALPPPPSKKPQHPPLKGGILRAWWFSSRKNQKMPGAHKIGAAISGPKNCRRKFCGHHAFSDFRKGTNFLASDVGLRIELPETLLICKFLVALSTAVGDPIFTITPLVARYLPKTTHLRKTECDRSF